MGKIIIYDVNELVTTFIEDLKTGLTTEYGDATSYSHLAVVSKGNRHDWNYSLCVTAETVGVQYGRERYRIGVDGSGTDLNQIVNYSDYSIDGLTKAIEEIQFTIVKEIRQKERNENATAFFREKTERLFNKIDDHTVTEIEDMVKNFIISIFDENDISANVGEIFISGSRSRGLEHAQSDIDIIVEVESNLKEYALFNIINATDFEIGGVKVDINPIRREETGAIETYLPIVEQYLTEKAEKKTKGE